MTGFIALHREAFAHPLLKDAERFRAFFWLVANAAWKPTRHDARGKTIEVNRGQICAGREHLAKSWGWSPSAVERFLARLETEQMIERHTGQLKTVITICNYDKYQDQSDEVGHMSGQSIGQKPDRNRTAKEQGNKETSYPSDTSYPQDAAGAGNPDPVEIPEKPKRKAAAKRAVGVDHPMPEGWMPVLTPDAQRAVDGWPPGLFETQLAAFRDHAADKGRLSKDWQAAFRTWIRKTQIREPANDRSTLHRSASPQPDRRSTLARAIDEGIDWLDR